MKKILKFFWKGLVPAEFNYPVSRIIPNALYGKGATLTQNLRFVIGFVPLLREFLLKSSVSERIVEDPFVLANVFTLKKGSRILDFGCYSSMVPLQLSSLGYKVTGVDLYKYPFKHPNFVFYNNDILDLKLKEHSYDCIYAISSLEHIGLGWYEKERVGISDSAVVGELARILKPGGVFLVTLPFGRFKQTPYLEVYDSKTIKGLFKNFILQKMEYYEKKSDTVWEYIGHTKPKLPKLKRGEVFNCVTCIKLRKPTY